MIDATISTEKDSQDVMQLHPSINRNFEGACGVNIRADIEEGVTAHPPGLMRFDGVGYLVSGVAIDAIMHPGRLIRRIVGHLVLEEDGLAVLAIPDKLVLLIVFHEQTVRRDIVAIDDHTGISGVGGPAHAIAVIRSPRPDIVQQDIIAVDDQTGRGLAKRRSPNAEEYILQRRRVGWV